MQESSTGHQPAWSSWHKGLMALIGSVIGVISLQSYTDPDLWGHLRFGLDAIASGTITKLDPYSYLSQGHPWINHEWLMEVFMGVAWLAGGERGLILLRLIVYMATLGIILWWLARVKQLSFIPAVIVWLSVFIATVAFGWVVRPQIFTFLLFTITLIIIDRAEHGHYRGLWFMPLIIATWVNLHGGFLAGCGVLGVWTIAHLAFNRQSWRQVIPPVALSALATLANPYGWDLLRFLLETATGDRPEIADWTPLALRSSLGLVYLAIMGMALLSLHFSTLPRRPILIGLFFLVAIMPLVAVRHLPLMGIAFAIFASEHVGIGWQQIVRHQRDVPIPRQIQVLPVVLAVLVALGGVLTFNWRFASGMDMPYNAMVLLRESGFRGRLMNDFGWGQFLIWHLGPAVQVGMDGRRETVYPHRVYEQYLDFHAGVNDWEAILRYQPPDAILVLRDSPPANLLTLHPDWQPIFTDEFSVLFVNPSSAAAQTIIQRAQTFVPLKEVPVFP
ncbi:hypothetical protein [Chloroflexus sp.]|uniref:hypothetical protein n=1 Tax=Chloroflexus sp. TaxID=1904827 RepID=UPI00298ED634|nr:hypothetical protein [Chloroflexus sp.]MCS6887226.1 hypothetical protein [Chloroflexus sp.]MDW8403439.1 hypothetical protein [Chloroflexus sp.]